MTRVAQFNHSETPPPSIWGVPGDQLKRPGEYETAHIFLDGELNIVPWYNGDWTYCFRPLWAQDADDLAKYAERAARNINVGYSQTNDRESFYRELEAVGWDPAKINRPCNGDCSSGFAALSTAANMKMPRDLYTGNMLNYAVQSGYYLILTKNDYLNRPEYLLRGDVLLRPVTENRGGHTLTVIDNGSEADIKVKGMVKEGTWNMRSYTYIDGGENVLTVLKGGTRITIYTPAVYCDDITWYMVQLNGGWRGWLSSIAIIFDNEVETTRDTWQRTGYSASYSQIQVVPAGQRLVWSGKKEKDWRGVYWYEILYRNKWGWISGNNAEIIAK